MEPATVAAVAAIVVMPADDCRHCVDARPRAAGSVDAAHLLVNIVEIQHAARTVLYARQCAADGDVREDNYILAGCERRL